MKKTSFARPLMPDKEDNSLILVTAESKDQPLTQQALSKNLPNLTVSPYDLGGHSPYFSSHKIFSSPSSFFFLTFSR